MAPIYSEIQDMDSIHKRSFAGEWKMHALGPYNYRFNSFKRNPWMKFLVVLVLIGLLFFPRATFDMHASIRLEDVAGVFLLMCVTYRFLDGGLRLESWMLLPLAYFLYVVAISTARYLAGQTTLGFVVFFGKEFQFFIFMLAFYYFASHGRDRFIWRAALILSGLVAAWGLVHMLMGEIDYYGISGPFLYGAPSLAGQVYSFSAIFGIAYLLLYPPSGTKRLLLYGIIGLNVLSCFATVSRSSGLGLAVFIILLLVGKAVFHIHVHRRGIGSVISAMVLGLVAIVAVYLIVDHASTLFDRLSRYGHITDLGPSLQQRAEENWLTRIKLIENALDAWVGLGYGVAHAWRDAAGHLMMDFRMAYDSQYMRNILVLGVVGSLIWVWMLAGFGWYMRKQKRFLALYLSLLGYYLVAGVGLESFNLSKSGAMFWLFTGLLLGLAHYNQHTHILNCSFLGTASPGKSITNDLFVSRLGVAETGRSQA